MAKKASADQAPESKPAKKTTTRKSPKPATKKTAEAKQTAAKAAITSIASATPASPAPKAEKKAPKSSKIKSPATTQAAPSAPVAPAASTTPSGAQEQKAPQPPRQHPVIQVRRESFRPKQQENRHDESSPNEGFSQPETVGGGDTFSSNNNRNKRRNRNRNNRRQNDERQEEQRPQDNVPGSGRKLDPDKLTKRAWKIFLAEVTEEGLALMDDNTSRETAKRAFRVAEFFMQEESRRKHPNDQPRPARPNQPQASEASADKANKEASADQPSSEEN